MNSSLEERMIINGLNILSQPQLERLEDVELSLFASSSEKFEKIIICWFLKSPQASPIMDRAHMAPARSSWRCHAGNTLLRNYLYVPRAVDQVWPSVPAHGK
jgi:hypothetical protein